MTTRSLYSRYLATDHWRRTRRQALTSAHNHCEDCGTTKPPLHVHHSDYVFLGREHPSHLEVLCETCHGERHDPSQVRWETVAPVPTRIELLVALLRIEENTGTWILTEPERDEARRLPR